MYLYLITRELDLTAIYRQPSQVVYRLETDSPADRRLFSVATRDGQAVLKLEGELDYERQPFYQLQVLAVDRAATNAHTG